MEKIEDNNYKIYCGNCGKLGHTYRKCTEPVTSTGIIAFKENPDYNYDKVFLVCRKDSIGYSELLRGRYDIYDKKYIKTMLEVITQNEVNKIKDLNDFGKLRLDLGIDLTSKHYMKEYDEANLKFNVLKQGIKDYSLSTILKEIGEFWEEPEWGFPKGRRHLKESDLECAEREFQEETGFCRDDYQILYNVIPLEEYFIGSNSVRYKHIYYFAKIITDNDPKIDPTNLQQVCEVGNVGWFTYSDSLMKIRPYHREKLTVLKKAFSIIRAKKFYFNEFHD
jgi:8-oxo-dGTP pyrophosphatase MutT (NUDIX family)